MRFAILMTLLMFVFSGTTYAQPDATDSLIEQLVGNDENNLDGQNTQKLIEALQSGSITEANSTEPKITSADPTFKIQVKMSETQEEHLRKMINEYLGWHKRKFNSPGVELLKLKHLDSGKLSKQFRALREGNALSLIHI